MLDLAPKKRLLRRLAVLAVLALLAVGMAPTSLLARPQVTSIVVDHRTGAVVLADDADAVNYPASLTKMMTLYLAFEALDAGKIGLKTRLKVSRHAASMPPSKLGLKPGSTIPLEDAIRAVAVKSANDVAAVIGEALGGSETRFAQQMTRKARALGMTRTTFMNASGLPNIKQRSTARDMAILSRRLIRDFPNRYAYFSLPKFTWGGRTYTNHNRLLASYPGMDGLKTGYIRASGYNLAASAVRDGRRLVAVVLGGSSSGSRNKEMARLLDAAFEKLRKEPVLVARAMPELPEARPRPLPTARPVTVVASLDPAPELPADAPAGAYAVQIGAFSQEDAAQRAAEAVRAKTPALLRGSDILVTRSSYRRKLFAARFVSFDRNQADQVCDDLKKRRQDCLVVKVAEVEIGSD